MRSFRRDKDGVAHEAVAKPHLKSAGRDMVGNTSRTMAEDSSGLGDVVLYIGVNSTWPAKKSAESNNKQSQRIEEGDGWLRVGRKEKKKRTSLLKQAASWPC